MITALYRRIDVKPEKKVAILGGKQALGLIAGTVLWAVYFYGVDFLLMQAQGLPVTMNLMPK